MHAPKFKTLVQDLEEKRRTRCVLVTVNVLFSFVLLCFEIFLFLFVFCFCVLHSQAPPQDGSVRPGTVSAKKVKCGCTAGANLPKCSHIFTAITALVWLQADVIKAGEIGGGEKAWGGTK